MDKLVEISARACDMALMRNNGHSEEAVRKLEQMDIPPSKFGMIAARAALDAILVDHAIMPKVATEEMEEAGYQASAIYGSESKIYTAMLAASPYVKKEPKK